MLSPAPLTWLALCLVAGSLAVASPAPFGAPGESASYRRADAPAARASDVTRFTLALGPIDTSKPAPAQWMALHATKANGDTFTVWILSQESVFHDLARDEPSTRRYLLQEGLGPAREFVDRDRGGPVLPSTGAWPYLWPTVKTGALQHGVAAELTQLLGGEFQRDVSQTGTFPGVPAQPVVIALRPHLRIGLPSNSRTIDSTRRFDGSDYPMARLTRADYEQMIDAGVTVVRVDKEQAPWVENASVYHWGLPVADLRLPEALYRSHFIGPALFLDEPAVGTRDQDIRPRFAKEPALRHEWTPERMFEAFRQHYHHTITEGAPSVLMKGLRARTDLTLGTLQVPQANLYSWETMPATALWQLTGEPVGGPRSFVFEPPGRLGTRRTIPEMNMAYGCQLSPDNPLSLSDTVFSFLRGAARNAHKDWGVSIYGAVNPADAPFLLTRAYDLGATDFAFWDNYQLACVPFTECLALTRHLVAHAARHPERDRDLDRLRQAADTLLLLPPGYDLGHVQMGRGNLWGLPELNLERRNALGFRHRDVMAALFTEIERCQRLGIPFDAAWNLPDARFTGYREIVRIRKDGRIDLLQGSKVIATRKSPRTPVRPPGAAPRLEVDLRATTTAATGATPREPRASFIAGARIREVSSPVYYTTGSDARGEHPNARVLWELYGPLDEDYRTLLDPGAHPRTEAQPDGWIVSVEFKLTQPGHYRLRAATVDTDGRTAVSWKEFDWKP